MPDGQSRVGISCGARACGIETAGAHSFSEPFIRHQAVIHVRYCLGGPKQSVVDDPGGCYVRITFILGPIHNALVDISILLSECDTRSPMIMCLLIVFPFVHKFDIALEIVPRCAQNERKMHTN